MASVITSAALAPVVAEPTPRAEQVTQLVLGETAGITESAGEWRCITADYDGYTGWVHAGYLLAVTDAAAAAWRRGSYRLEQRRYPVRRAARSTRAAAGSPRVRGG